MRSHRVAASCHLWNPCVPSLMGHFNILSPLTKEISAALVLLGVTPTCLSSHLAHVWFNNQLPNPTKHFGSHQIESESKITPSYKHTFLPAMILQGVIQLYRKCVNLKVLISVKDTLSLTPSKCPFHFKHTYPIMRVTFWSTLGSPLSCLYQVWPQIQWILLLSATSQKDRVINASRCVLVHLIHGLWPRVTSHSFPKWKWPWKVVIQDFKAAQQCN